MAIEIERPEGGVRQERELAWLRAENERLEGLLEYTAMMADIELPEREDEADGV